MIIIIIIICFEILVLTLWRVKLECTLRGKINKIIKQKSRLLKYWIRSPVRSPVSYHHCAILTKHSLLSWDNLTKFSNMCLVFKVLNELMNLLNKTHRVANKLDLWREVTVSSHLGRVLLVSLHFR